MNAHRLAAAVLLFLFCRPVLAGAEQSSPKQPPPPRPSPTATATPFRHRLFIGINGGYQTNTRTFSESHREPAFEEETAWQTNYRVTSGAQFDAAGGVRVWRNLFAGVAYTYFSRRAPASISGEVPHPFFFDQPRAFAGDTTALAHEQQAIHVSAVWVFPASRRVEISIFGGPSYFAAARSFVEDAIYDEAYPFDSTTFSRAATARATAHRVGVHGGGDFAWLLTRHVGVGVLLRYAQADVKFATPAGGSVSLDAGGFQVGAGVRLRFALKGPPRAPAPPRRAAPERPLKTAA
jgi:hypothetical protein